jgi:hypothetical protein
MLGDELEPSKVITSPVRIFDDGEYLKTDNTSPSPPFSLSSKTQPARLEKTIKEARRIGKEADFIV